MADECVRFAQNAASMRFLNTSRDYYSLEVAREQANKQISEKINSLHSAAQRFSEELQKSFVL